MFDVEFPAPAERVIVAGLYRPGSDSELFAEDIAEMVTLCKTSGALVMETVVQNLNRPKAATYFGTGKLKEIKERMIELDCKSLIVDAELKPSQIQNIEEIIEGKVIDRSQLILDIFSLHAKTNEAKIQVELAQLEVLYPRLTRMWGHLSRQMGGIGTRGPGETQLETDRRLVQKKIAVLKKRLDKIEKSRKTQRKSRNNLFKCTLVGYTNVGKSTLLNAISGSDVLTENKLFATLDTSTRKTRINGAGDVLISDTVGFLRKLPHDLVASFRSTLEVLLDSDLLLIIMDASSKWYNQQMDTVKSVVKDLGAEDRPYLIIFNKIDLLENSAEAINDIEKEFSHALFVSSFSTESVANLKDKIGEHIVKVKRENQQENYIIDNFESDIEAG